MRTGPAVANCPTVSRPETRRPGLRDAPKVKHDYHQWVEGHLGRYQATKTADDYRQAGERWRTFKDWEREDLVANLAEDLRPCPEHIARRMVWHFWWCDPEYGQRVAERAGIDLETAKRLPPLEGRPAPGEDRVGPTYTTGERERGGSADREREWSAPPA